MDTTNLNKKRKLDDEKENAESESDKIDIASDDDLIANIPLPIQLSNTTPEEAVAMFPATSNIRSQVRELGFFLSHTQQIHKAIYGPLNSGIMACPLMREFSAECGATMPETLRGTTLRKHIAIYTAMLNIEENQVDGLANFMGHNEQIHKNVYRVPGAVKDVTDVSQLLQSAMGMDENETDDEDADIDADEAAQSSTAPVIRQEKELSEIESEDSSDESEEDFDKSAS